MQKNLLNKMNEEQFYIFLIIVVFIIGFIGYSIGQSNCNCDNNPANVEYWKTKYLEEQQKNELLKNQILEVLINSYTKKLIWSVSGLTPYKMICYANYSSFEMPQEFKATLDNLCKS